MHELSIALSMIEMATEESGRRGGARVTALHLKLGPLSGVVKEALLFSYEVACLGTALEGSQLVIEDVPVVIYCPRCEAERTMESIQRFSCPACGTLTSEVRSGKELEVVALEIEEPESIRDITVTEHSRRLQELAP
ncbi:MAG: hydrogenase maturation nickel metallochaperone HypA [Acidobacteriota bacterium]